MNQQKTGRYRWVICALIFFATTVNYLDRQVLSLLAPDLKTLFAWSNNDYSNIVAVFTFIYALSMLFAGRIIDQLGTKTGYILAIVVWSLGAAIHAAATSMGAGVYALLGTVGLNEVREVNGTLMINGVSAVTLYSIAGFMVARAVLAFGEAGNFPAAIKATAEYFPKRERSLATGLFNSGANVGAVLAPLTVPFIALKWGWEWAFIIVGAIGLSWVALWWAFYDAPAHQKRLSASELEHIHSDVEPDDKADVPVKTSWFKLLGYRQTWAFTFGKFMTDGVWWFFLFWLPLYLSSQYGMASTEFAIPLAVIYTVSTLGSVAGGAFPAFFVNKGWQVFNARRAAMLTIAFVPLVVLLAQPLGHISFWVPVIAISIGTAAHQAWSANIFTTVSDMFPKRSVASVVGIGGFAGGIGGVLLNKLGGALFDHYEAVGDKATGYAIMFAICATAYLVAWVVMRLLVPTYRPITGL